MNLTFFAGLTTGLIVSLGGPYISYYCYVRRYSRLKVESTSADQNEYRNVSVIICTLNERDVIEKKLRELLNQDYSLEHLEVIVVDGGSTDGTLGILSKLKVDLGSRVKLVVLRDGTLRSKAHQINEGISAAHGEIVVTTDADIAIDKSSIKTLVDAFSTPNVGAVCARQVLTNAHDSAVTETEATYRGFYEILRIGESNLHSTPIYHGGLSAYVKRAVSRIDEDVNADDTQLALSVIRNGFRATYEPRSVFYVAAPSGLRETWHQRVRRGQGLERVLWRNRGLARNRRYGRFGFPILPVEFFMHLISPFLFLVTASSLVTFLALSIVRLPLLLIPYAFGTGALFLCRKALPVSFMLSFAFYQAALVWGFVLHMSGHNYRRWSGIK